MPRRAILGVAVAMLTLVGAAPASATQSPAGCKSNEMKISIGRDRGVPVYANGETIVYSIKVSNVGAEGCDVDGVTMVLHLPAADGTPTGQTVTLVTGASFPVGSAERVISTIPYKLAVNPGVTDAVAQVQVTAGLLHDAPNDHQYRELKEVGTDVVKPTIAIDKTGSITSGQAPQNVTYTYEVTNTSPVPVPLDKVRVSDDLCTNPVYARGDDGDGKLAQNEKWWFTCSMLHAAAGTYVNTAKACAVNALDDNHEEVCSPPDTWTVTLTPPPGTPPTTPDTPTTPSTPSTPSTPNTPVGQVLPATQTNPPSATKPSACLATPNRVRVRAKELTTIRVKVNGATAGTLVTVTGPGVKRTARTDSSGVATIRVKPTRSGTLTIKTAGCSNARKVSVLAARRTASRQVPKVTGYVRLLVAIGLALAILAAPAQAAEVESLQKLGKESYFAFVEKAEKVRAQPSGSAKTVGRLTRRSNVGTDDLVLVIARTTDDQDRVVAAGAPADPAERDDGLGARERAQRPPAGQHVAADRHQGVQGDAGQERQDDLQRTRRRRTAAMADAEGPVLHPGQAGEVPRRDRVRARGVHYQRNLAHAHRLARRRDRRCSWNEHAELDPRTNLPWLRASEERRHPQAGAAHAGRDAIDDYVVRVSTRTRLPEIRLAKLPLELTGVSASLA